jgi:hypothetical protein
MKSLLLLNARNIFWGRLHILPSDPCLLLDSAGKGPRRRQPITSISVLRVPDSYDLRSLNCRQIYERWHYVPWSRVRHQLELAMAPAATTRVSRLLLILVDNGSCSGISVHFLSNFPFTVTQHEKQKMQTSISLNVYFVVIFLKSTVLTKLNYTKLNWTKLNKT